MMIMTLNDFLAKHIVFIFVLHKKINITNSKVRAECMSLLFYLEENIYGKNAGAWASGFRAE